MHRSIIRTRRVFSFFGSKKPDFNTVGNSLSVTVDDNDKKGNDNMDDDLEKIDMDAIRARGILHYRFNYTPPDDLNEQIKLMIKKSNMELMKNETNWRDISFRDLPSLKFKLLVELSTNLGHSIPNSRLHTMKTVGDVGDFYQESIRNVGNFGRLARREDLPVNLHISEQPKRFHPEDTEEWHGGVTAFPGQGGQVYGIRNKRLFRQFNPKKDWYDFGDPNFVYDRKDKNMPWDPKIAEKMDGISSWNRKV